MRDCERTKIYFLNFYTSIYCNCVKVSRDFLFKKNTEYSWSYKMKNTKKMVFFGLKCLTYDSRPLKDGLTIEDVIAENKIKEDTQNIINEFYELLRNEDIRGIRKMLRRNELLNDLNTRELNEDFPINEYKFVKRNGKLTFIHDFNYHPKESVVDYNNSINENMYNEHIMI